MPFPNEHAARLRDPDQFDRFRRNNRTVEFQEGDERTVGFIFGINDDGSEIQALRFPKDTWSESEARNMASRIAEDDDVTVKEFEPASGDDSESESASRTEMRVCPTRVKVRDNRDDHGAGDRILEGYGAVYYDPKLEGSEFKLGYDPDLGKDIVERIEPGAFDEALEQNDLRSLFNHDPNHPLGRESAGTLESGTDSVGLWYRVRLPNSPVGDTVAESVNRGDVQGSSFAFRDLTDPGEMFSETKDAIIRHLRKVDVEEHGPVTFPAYEGTSTGLDQNARLRQVRSAYDAWKQRRMARQQKARKRKPEPQQTHSRTRREARLRLARAGA